MLWLDIIWPSEGNVAEVKHLQSASQGHHCFCCCRDVDSPRVRRGSNTPAQKLGSSAVFPSFMGVANGGNSAAAATSGLSHSGSVAVPAGLDISVGNNAAMHASFERPMTAAALSGSTAGSSVGMAAGMADMFGQTRPDTAALQSEIPSGGL